MIFALSRRQTRIAGALLLPVFLVLSAGCDIVTADLKHSEKAEWRKSYELAAGGRVEISNVNGKIQVEPSSGSSVEVVAEKIGRGASPESARAALERIEIQEEATGDGVRVSTRMRQAGGGWFGGGSQVQYMVRVPAGVQGKFSTVNGGVELSRISGQITAETTNGGVVARELSGTIEASSTNGGVDVDLVALNSGGVKLHCTNGGIKLSLPADVKASISARITNGGIDTGGLPIATTESTRRRLEGTLNGGGIPVQIQGTNGGIEIVRR